jgi:hypothetical protein
MTAIGSDRNPARYIDADPGKKPMTARRMRWNTDTWDVKLDQAKTVKP